eukprot:CAMPEP_0118716252 /NCGR_PEP_ID=MMETSP0800-20121206/27387_1 /TAXON_ID=210618 ORGANISM="Striatella unipunctata, Strain CCMP2910" /NCGR_SAMPLE_ID=MMETSP0800 /ASSEMBLY_ACC=CAM_ASM_000638 /LENGTH=146 /DNA_ID=CAMNT_0006622631 /DNA_START=137 /DNA_END=577 /DNA_ORIENTATION=-
MENRQTFSLVTVTALYMAVKLFEPKKKACLELGVLARLGRGVFVEHDIIFMERFMLHVLEWRLQTPTAMSFVRYLMSLLPAESLANVDDCETVMELARFQTELAVQDSRLFTTPASVLALAALQNALKAQVGGSLLPKELQESLFR